MHYNITTIQAISSMLGWDDMLVSIAVPAIERMLDNLHENVAEATGDDLSEEDLLGTIKEFYEPDDVFGLLIETLYTSEEDLQMFISLRYEIEEFMKMGFSFEDARREWDV